MKKDTKDTRKITWSDIENDIQQRSRKKDKTFVLKGPWKKFVRKQDGFSVYAVKGEWVRNNLSIIFGHGGHGIVHEFIPLKEIWVSTHHFENCGCTNLKKPNQKMSWQCFDSTTIHEIEEHQQMKTGKTFWESHNLALKKECEVGLLGDDPYREI